MEATIIAAVCLFIFQIWILPFIGLVTIGLIFTIPARLLQRGMEPDEDYAADHPWRVHWVAFAFTSARVATVLVESFIAFYAVGFTLERVPSINFKVLFVEVAIFALYWLNNARTMQSVWNSLSYRLYGGTSTVHFQHGQRHLPPDEVLGPIPVRHHGW